VERAQARDRDAFEMLVERHLGDVHRIAVAIVGPADAMDITQGRARSDDGELRVRSLRALAPPEGLRPTEDEATDRLGWYASQ
jgi:hypothetical protein